MSNATPSDATLAQIQSASTDESAENSHNEPPPPPIQPNTVRENGTPSPLTMPSLPSNAHSSNTGEEMVSI
jgi:hypothetical protein